MRPCHNCRHILETSEVDYVLFEAAGLIKDGLVREWRSVSKEEVAAMRAYLLAYVINRPALSGYVRERLVQVGMGIRLLTEGLHWVSLTSFLCSVRPAPWP